MRCILPMLMLAALSLATHGPAPAKGQAHDIEPATTTASEADEGQRAATIEMVAPGLEVVNSVPESVGERVTFRSAILGAEVSMLLYIPESFHLSSDEHTYPVLFAHGEHGEQFFPTLVGIVKHLGDRELIPEMIVATWGDAEALPEIHTNGMWEAERFDAFGDPRTSLRHLEEEVFPYLKTRYRANDYRLLVGVSGSALFPLHTLTHAPDLFDATFLFAAADMIGMGYRPGETFLDALDESLTSDPRRKLRLFLATPEADLEGREDYRANLRELETRFTKFEGVEIGSEVMAETDHYEVLIPGLRWALGRVFPRERWSARYREIVAQPGDALENLDRYYRDLSRDTGFSILPRADRWNNVNDLRFMIRHLIGLERTDEAIAVARRLVRYRPTSPESYQGLADSLEANGQLVAAVEAQRRALDLARGETDALETRLEELRAKLPSG